MKVLTRNVLVGCCIILLLTCNENNTNIDNVSKPKTSVKSVSKNHASANISLFTLLPPEETGIHFVNQLQSSEDFNIMTYEYAYNGSGVAIGDINNDGLPDIYMAGNFMANKLFLNKGNLKFQDITATSGIASQGYTSGVSMADVNGDGLLDIYVCRTSTLPEAFRQNKLYINNGDLTFTERANEYKVASIAFSTQAYFLDYDHDNDLDMYLLNHRFDFKNAQHVKLERDPKTKQLRLAKPKIHPLVTDRLFRNENGK